MRTRWPFALAAALSLWAFGAAAQPAPPCAPGAVSPAYAAADARPNVGVWRDLTLSFGGACPEVLDGPADLVVALSGQFSHGGTRHDLAARVGRISATEGLSYWSVTSGAWRTLISEASALSAPDTGARRGDFSAAEVLSGRPLYLMQRDTRSSGVNLYALQGRPLDGGGFMFWIVNLSDIRFLLARLFEPGGLISAHVFTPLRGDIWGYYSLTVAKDGITRGRAASFVNRAAAFERHFTGESRTGAAPLAP
ncbi:MAG: DUF6675 family protein [Pseudomonadota bacterium]